MLPKSRISSQQVTPLLCLAFLAVSAEPEELNIPFSDELVDSLIEDLKPLENENIADTRAGKMTRH